MNTPEFIEKLNEFIQKITPENEKELLPENTELLRKTLTEIAAACDDYDSDTANELILSLREYKWNDEIVITLEEISKLILHGEFEEACGVCRAAQNEFGG
jgi:hypothetical protein